jgi:integrase
MWYLGLRVTETTRITWADCGTLDTITRRLSIPAAYTKNHHARTIPIPLPLARKLIAQQKHHYIQDSPLNYHRTVISRKPNQNAPTPRAIQKAFSKAAAIAGLGRITPHTIRHTFATRLLAVSSTRLVQLALGHKSITTTELYTHPTIDQIELAMARAFVEEN